LVVVLAPKVKPVSTVLKVRFQSSPGYEAAEVSIAGFDP
jgi:hypothetical protein